MDVCWYKDRVTEIYLASHDVSDPGRMTPEELVTALTYIEESQFDSEYARELCRRAGNIEKWESGAYKGYEVRARATKNAAENFGCRLM